MKNETGDRRPWVETGLWLEQDRDSELFDDNGPYLFIITDDSLDGCSENEGPDHVKYVSGLHKGKYVIDVLNSICQVESKEVNPNNWVVDWATLGFVVVDECLKRFNPIDGYYHV